jgi:hypothetical protein
MSVAVTMFFNLKALSDATTEVRPVEFYVNNGRTTLSQQVPMVILCDSHTRPWIEELRTQLAPGVNTVYVEKSLQDYEHYSLNHSIITENRRGNPNYVNSRNTPSCFLIYILKFHALKIAENLFPDATHYYWLDFGCAHIARDAETYLPKMLANPNPKISCMYIHYRSNSEIANMQRYMYAGNPCSMAATVFSVEKSYVNKLFTHALSIFYEMLSKGIGHTDEVVLTYLYSRFPDMFHLYYGDYYSTVSNYTDVVMNYSEIKRFFIGPTLASGRHDLAKTCATAILQSVSKGVLSLPQGEITYLQGL